MLLGSLGGTRRPGRQLGKRGCLMKASHRHNRIAHQHLVLATLAAVFCSGQSVSANSFSSNPERADSHASLCKCASRCHGDACCCGRSTSPPGARDNKSPVSADPSESNGKNPCLRQAPCGDPALPTGCAGTNPESRFPETLFRNPFIIRRRPARPARLMSRDSVRKIAYRPASPALTVRSV